MIDFIKIKDFFEKIDFKINLEHIIINDSFSDVQLKINNKIVYADVRKEVRPQHAKLFKFKFEIKKDVPFIIVSDYITPNAKKLIRDMKLNYIDGFGNIFLNLEGMKLYIEKGNSKPIYNKYSDVFTKAGGQVLFQLLKNPENINLSQRKLAELSSVSLGSTSKIINGLFNQGFTVKWNNEKKYQLIKRKELLDKWITLVNEKVLPANKIGCFSFSKTGHFLRRETDPNFEIKWGGESGAEIMTKYLNPEKFSLFTNRPKIDLITKYRLIPNNDGEITVYKSFWKLGASDFNSPDNDVAAHPLLIYAELIYSDNDRNIETAKLIYKEYVEPKL